MKIGDLIEDKILDVRLDGKTPHYIGLLPEVWEEFNKEMQQKMTFGESNSLPKVTSFFGLFIVCMGGPFMPADGVYVHPKESLKFKAGDRVILKKNPYNEESRLITQALEVQERYIFDNDMDGFYLPGWFVDLNYEPYSEPSKKEGV